MAKMPIWPSESPRNRPPSDSTTPISSPPANAPAKLPMPPSTTMVKATSTKPPPTCGLTYAGSRKQAAAPRQAMPMPNDSA